MHRSVMLEDEALACDRDIIDRSRTDPAAFGTIFDRYFDVIYGYATRRAGAQVGESVASETFATAFDKRFHYDLTREDARPWLYGIATNLLRRHWRSEKRRRRALLRLRRQERTAAVDDVEVSELDEDLRAAIRALDQRDRDVLLLYAWGDLTYREIADALGIPLGTVQSRLHRVRRALRQRMRSPAIGHGTDLRFTTPDREITDG